MIKVLSLTWSTVKQMAFKRVQILQIGLGLLCQSYFNSIYYHFFFHQKVFRKTAWPC